MSTARDLGSLTWRKSSYSNAEGGNCLEVADGPWRKSSYSNGEGGDCLEVCVGTADLIPVRDSKNPTGPALMLSAQSWTTFVNGVKDRPA